MIDINIYFGEVVSVGDSGKLNRLRVKIPGKTELLTEDELPWYFPFLGMDFLPIVGDKVPVLIFDDNFTTGFYGKKIPDSNNAQSSMSTEDYVDYLEIFNRNGVQLTYKKSTGIEFINGNVKIQALEDIYQIFINDNHFKMTKSRFDLGTGGEATPLGDKTVAVLLKQVALSNQMYNNCLDLFNTVKAGCGNNPMLAGIKIGLTANVPIKKLNVKSPISELQSDINKIQSKKTFIE